MISENITIMFYIDNLEIEKAFWKQLGFIIFNETSHPIASLSMKPNNQSTLTFTLYEKETIKKLSPEVVNNIPSVLFETNNLEQLQDKLIHFSSYFVSDIQDVPFKSFSFSCPSGIYFAVKETSHQ